MSEKVSVLDSGASVIAATENAGMMYLHVRLWPAPNGCHYISCADIAALYEVMQRSPGGVSGIGVKLVHQEQA